MQKIEEECHPQNRFRFAYLKSFVSQCDKALLTICDTNDPIEFLEKIHSHYNETQYKGSLKNHAPWPKVKAFADIWYNYLLLPWQEKTEINWTALLAKQDLEQSKKSLEHAYHFLTTLRKEFKLNPAASDINEANDKAILQFDSLLVTYLNKIEKSLDYCLQARTILALDKNPFPIILSISRSKLKDNPLDIYPIELLNNRYKKEHNQDNLMHGLCRVHSAFTEEELTCIAHYITKNNPQVPFYEHNYDQLTPIDLAAKLGLPAEKQYPICKALQEEFFRKRTSALREKNISLNISADKKLTDHANKLHLTVPSIQEERAEKKRTECHATSKENDKLKT